MCAQSAFSAESLALWVGLRSQATRAADFWLAFDIAARDSDFDDDLICGWYWYGIFDELCGECGKRVDDYLFHDEWSCGFAMSVFERLSKDKGSPTDIGL